MNDLESTVAGHVVEIANIKANMQNTEDRIYRQLREVQQDMRNEIAKYDEKLNDVRQDVRDINKKIDGAFNNLRRSVPTWASLVITGLGLLIAFMHW